MSAPPSSGRCDGQKGMAGITVLRLATRTGVGVGFADDSQRFALREGRLTHRNTFYAVADTLADSTANRYARALARWSPMSAGELSETDSQAGELLRALGITDPRELDVDRLWAESAAGAIRSGRWYLSASGRAAICSM